MESVSLQRKLIELKTKLLPLQQILLIPELKEAVDMIQKCIDTEELVETSKPYEPLVCLDKVNVPQIYTDLYNINDSWHGCQEAITTAMTYGKVDNSRFFETFEINNFFWENLINELTTLSASNDIIALILLNIEQQISDKNEDCSWDDACNILVSKYMLPKYGIDDSEIKKVHDVIEKVRNDTQSKYNINKLAKQANTPKKEPFTFERIYEECMEISKEHNISVRLFDFNKQMSYYIHWSETLTDPIRTSVSVNEFKDAIAKDPRMKNKLGLLLFEKDNILIYANISTYKMTNEIKDRFTELFS